MRAMGRPSDGFGRSLAAGAALAGAYWLAAVVGLRWAAVGGAGSSVMPAAGVALAGLLLGGARLWPAVVVGRLLAAWTVGSTQPFWADAAIAGGNALAAASQAWLLHRRARLDPRLAAVRDVLRLALGAASGAAVSALVGTGALWLAAGFDAGRAAVVGATWWLGNLVGALTVAPLVLAWSPREARAMPARARGHLAALLAAAALVSYAIFVDPPTPYLRTWYALPVLVWAALAFQVRGAAAALAVVSAVSIWGTTVGAGPFAALADGAVERVFFAQQFAAVASFTVLVLAAAGAERRAALAGLEATVAARTAALREGEARSRALAEATPALLFEADAGGRNLHVNRRFVDYTGLPLAGLLGEGWLRVLHPDDRAHAAAAWAAAVRDGTPYEVEYRLRRRDGAHRWFLGRGVPVRDGAGRVARWVGTCADIDERKRAETVLARDKAELERLVEARTRELERAREQLAHAQRMEALGQLAGGVAHDFNNVLQVVQGGAALIEERAGARDDIRRLARMVSEAAGRGASTTRRLLAFSRRGELRAEAVDPAVLLAGLREILGHTLGAGIEIRVEARERLPMLLADKGQLETVLVNLATNARDAMPGGGALTLAAAEAVGHGAGATGVGGGVPGTLSASRYVRLSVTDTGAGMAPEVLARVAEPFFTTKPQGKGTGLGLAMAKGFAEQSGGALRVESAPGRGTTVALWLPLAAGPAATVAARPPGGDAGITRPGTRARVLLVDDDALVREVTAEQLEGAGYAVVDAETGPAALALLDAGEAVDLVVSDLSMPGMDGIAVIREARRRRPGLPAILLTGYATDVAELAVGGALSGTFSLVRKPVDARALAERVAVLLKGAAVGARTGPG